MIFYRIFFSIPLKLICYRFFIKYSLIIYSYITLCNLVCFLLSASFFFLFFFIFQHFKVGAISLQVVGQLSSFRNKSLKEECFVSNSAKARGFFGFSRFDWLLSNSIFESIIRSFAPFYKKTILSLIVKFFTT